MDQVTFYIAVHALFALGLAGTAVARTMQAKGGLIEWANDALNLGVVFILVLTIGTPMLA